MRHLPSMKGHGALRGCEGTLSSGWLGGIADKRHEQQLLLCIQAGTG